MPTTKLTNLSKEQPKAVPFLKVFQ